MRFLSAEWLDALTEAANAADLAERAPAEAVVIEHVVSGAPGGETRYHVVVDRTGVRFLSGSPEQPDATFHEDYLTAARLAAGRVSAQEVFFSGEVKVSGNTTVLVDNQDALAAIAAAVAPVRDTTEFPPDQ